jgi:transcriptional regulator with GAF, ATPase, and Fis domain
MTSGQQAQFLQQFTQLEKAIGQVRQLVDDVAAMNPAVANETNTLMRGVTNGMDNLRKSGMRMSAQVEQFQGLSRTAAMLNSSLEVGEVFEGVMDTIIQLTGAERAFIVLCEENELKMHTARNWDLENVPQGDATFSRSIVQATLDSKEPLLTTNAQADSRFQAAQSIAANALRSVLCVPLLVRDKAIGVIYTDNRVLAGLFDQDTETLLMTFAHQAAIAIDNARLFERVRADLKEAQKELQVLRVHVNQADLSKQVAEITDTDYFKKLESMVRQRREARRDTGN